MGEWEIILGGGLVWLGLNVFIVFAYVKMKKKKKTHNDRRCRHLVTTTDGKISVGSPFTIYISDTVEYSTIQSSGQTEL